MRIIVFVFFTAISKHIYFASVSYRPYHSRAFLAWISPMLLSLVASSLCYILRLSLLQVLLVFDSVKKYTCVQQ